MKRSPSTSFSSEIKRPKLHDGSLGLMEEQSITDMVQHGPDSSRCITGKFKLTWALLPGARKLSTIAAVQCGSQETIFPIDFEIALEDLSVLKFSPTQEFKLSLKGAKLQKVQQKTKPCNEEFKLVYSEGVEVEWGHPGSTAPKQYLNTWKENMYIDNDNWFSSQEEIANIAAVQHAIATNEKGQSLLKPTKKEQRMEAKRQKREVVARQVTESANLGDAVRKGNPILHPIPTTAKFISEPTPTAADASNTSKKVDFCFKGSPLYRSLLDLHEKQFVNLSGIVVDISEPKSTNSNQWMRCIQIVEPLSFRDVNIGSSSGFKVNCFTRRYKEWLPHPNLGEPIILRDVKVDHFNGALTGTGYSDKLRWVAFSPSTGDVHHGPKNKVPKEEALGNGYGALFSPFYRPTAEDIQHCISLSDWWRIKNNKLTNTTGIISQRNKGTRKHRLISEASPYAEPDGYFDCTVEVLKLFTSDGSKFQHTLYVTDYSRNDQMQGMSGSWPTPLNEYVMRFSMWDKAAEFAERNMRPGLFFSIQNARMKLDNSGVLEGKVTQDKIAQLDESDATTNNHMNALLERKQKWEAKLQNTGTDIEYQLLQDVEEGKFFHCTAELLHASCKPHEIPYICVTDYTLNRRLLKGTYTGSWSQGLEGHILKIRLSDDQRHIAESPSIGSFYAFRKLRLKFNTVEDQFCVYLGGTEKLIVMQNPDNTNNEHLNGLLRRKENWTRNRHSVQYRTNISESDPIMPIVLTVSNFQHKHGNIARRIRDMPLVKGQGALRHRVLAKVVDFYPLELRDAFYQRCTKCMKDIPENRKACFKCEDFDHEFVEYCYQMFILIEDENGDQIKVSLNDKCPLFDGLKRAHLKEDHLALHAFCGKIYPLLGQLVPMHDCIKEGRTFQVPGSPFFIFEVDSWVTLGDLQAFSLCQYEES